MPKLFARIRGRRALAWLKHRRRIGYQWVDLRGGDDLPPWATYTRPSAATYVDAQGVVQYGNMNLALQSQSLSNAAWTKTATSISAAALAPDNTVTAEGIIATAVNTQHVVLNAAGLTVPAGAVVTVSFFAAAGSETALDCAVYNAGATRFASRNFNLSTLATGAGGIGSGTYSVLASSAVADRNGYVRCTLTVQTATDTSLFVGVFPRTSSTWTGDGTSTTVRVWGMQFQLGSQVGPYLATTSAVRYAARTGHYVGSTGPLLLLEGARTNRCLQSNSVNVGPWFNNSGSETMGTGEADPFGGTAAVLLGNGGVPSSARVQTITFVGDGTKVVSVFLRAGTATTSQIRLRDNTAATDRHQVNVTWTGGVPSLATVGGSGTLYPVQALTGGWYRISFSVAGVVAANQNDFYVYPQTSAATGNIRVIGGQAEDAAFPSSYIPTTAAAVTRAADALSLPFGPVPQAVTFYKRVRFAGLPRLVWNYGTSGAYVSLAYNSTSAFTQHFNGVTSDASLLASTPALGDLVEMRGVLYADGSTRVFVSVNGGAESTGSATVPIAFGSASASPTLSLTDGGVAFDASERTLILPGVRSLTECRMAR